MKETLYKIPKMDCPSEERLIRMVLEDNIEVEKLNFDLPMRQLTIYHQGESENLLAQLLTLGFGGEILNSKELSEFEASLYGTSNRDAEEKTVLKLVFYINTAMFIGGLIAGLIAQSAGLLADSLDMFADAAVFALSIFAVGKARTLKKRAAKLSGYLQFALATAVLGEVVRKFITGSEPQAPLMIIMAAIAFIANASCMWLLAKHRNGEVHMKASWIFLTTDVIANLGVIIAGVLIRVTGSAIPDLVIGAIIASIVFFGSFRILHASK